MATAPGPGPRPAHAPSGAPDGANGAGEDNGEICESEDHEASEDGLQRSRRRRVRDLLVLGYSHAGQHAYVAGVGTTIPFVASTYHVSYATIGILLAVVAAFGSMFQLLAGIVRQSARRLLFEQNVGSTIAAVIGAVSPGIAIFFAGRLVQAIATWPQHPVGASYLSSRHPAKRGAVLSWHVTAGNIGTLVAPLAVTAVIATSGWHMAYVLLAALLATAAVAIGVGLRGPARTGPSAGVPSAGARVALREARAELAAIVRERPALALLVAGTVAAGGQGIGILSIYVPAYLKSGLGYRPLALGAVLTILYAGAVVGPVLMGYLSDRLGHHRVLLLNYVLGAIALGAFAFAGRAAIVLAPIGVAVGIFSYSELSLRQTAFAGVVGSERARAAFGLFFAASQAVGALWVAVVGIVVTDVGFRAAFVVMLATFLTAAAIVAWGRPERPAARVT